MGFASILTSGLIFGEYHRMISKSKFSEILLPIPSKEKQIQFVELFKKLYGLKVLHKLYLNNADSLFKSLQNQAFNGTL